MLFEIIMFLVIWTLLGYIINATVGYLSQQYLIKHGFFEDKREAERDLTIRNMQEGFDDPSDFRIVMDALFWPRTLFYALRGQKRILKDLRSKEK